MPRQVCSNCYKGEPNCDRKKVFTLNRCLGSDIYRQDGCMGDHTGGHAGDGTLGLWPVKELLTKEESETIEDIDIGARASNS